MTDTRTVHITVPAALKAAWVAESRAAGQRLSPWLLARLDRAIEPIDATPEGIRAWRARLGITQTQAAERLGVTSTAVAMWERGERPISRVVALACAAIESGLGESSPPV